MEFKAPAKLSTGISTYLRSAASLSIAFLVISVGVTSAQDKLDRTHLPIQEPKRPKYSELDVRNVKEKPPFFEVKAPKNAPNVVIVLIDDIGFGGPFGSVARRVSTLHYGTLQKHREIVRFGRANCSLA